MRLRKMPKFKCRIFIFTVLAAFTSPALAQVENPYFGDTVSLSAGVLFHRADASFAATLDDNTPIGLSLRDLGMGDNTTVAWSNLTWHISQRWHWGITYSAFRGSGFIEARTSGNFGDVEFDAGASLTSDLDVDVFITDINFDFFNSSRGRLGAGIGFHVTNH